MLIAFFPHPYTVPGMISVYDLFFDISNVLLVTSEFYKSRVSETIILFESDSELYLRFFYSYANCFIPPPYTVPGMISHPRTFIICTRLRLVQ